MKRYGLLLIMAISFSAFADLEHVEGMGSAPSKQKLSSSRGCFQEIRNLGCGHPREDQDFFTGCLEENKDSLSPSCKSFFEILYGKRKSS
jgi:hypothetical protein